MINIFSSFQNGFEIDKMFIDNVWEESEKEYMGMRQMYCMLVISLWVRVYG